MPLLSMLARMFLLRRLFGGGGHSRGYGRRGGRRPHRGRRHSGRQGFGMFGPIPTYSRTTRGGSRVKVGGCCLPIPLVLTAGLIGALRGLLLLRR